MKLQIAQAKDLPRIVAIYNQSIASQKVTADERPVTVSERQSWFEEHQNRRWPLFVIQEADAIAGWISLSPYVGRVAYDHTAEVSIYLDAAARRHGLGRAALKQVELAGKKVGIETIVALVIAANAASCALFAKCGYSRWGLLPDVMDFGSHKESLLIFGKKIG